MDQAAAMAEDVTVCICTYRRASLAEAVESVVRQPGLDAAALRIVVVDNDAEPSARPLVDAVRARLGARIDYVHAPARNISIARNAALDAVATRWAAFLDDDEYAAHDWLAQLYAAREGRHAVVGQVVALYQDDTPAWARACDFHSNRIAARLDNAYTSNVLLDMEFVNRHGLRFLEACGQTGGEDTVFFRALTTAGGSMAYCPGSIAYEEVRVARANLAWVFRRKYRFGQTHGLLLSMFDRRGFRLLPLTAGAKALLSAGAALALLPVSRHAALRWATRAALHGGAVSFTLHRAITREYA
jgi:succinoglycan biosynthesis protein ExoM